MDQRYLREWTSLIPKPPACFDLDNELKNRKIEELGVKSSVMLNQVTQQGKSKTECSFSKPIEQPQASHTSKSFKKKRGRPSLNSKIEQKKMKDIMPKEKRAMGIINDSSKSYDNSYSDLNFIQMQKSTKCTEFNPPKFSTPSKNDNFVNNPQLKTVNCQPNRPSVRKMKNGPAPASKKYQFNRSLICSPGALQKKLSTIQRSQPSTNVFEISNSDINNDTGKKCTDHKNSKKLIKLKSSLRNFRPKVYPSPPSTTISSSSEKSDDDSDIDINITRLSEDDDIDPMADENQKEMGCKQQISNEKEGNRFKEFEQIYKRIPKENSENVKEPKTAFQNKVSLQKLNAKKILNKSCLVKDETQTSMLIPNVLTKERNYDEKYAKNLNTDIQLNKSKYDVERHRKLRDVFLSKNTISQKSTTSEEVQKLESFSKGTVGQHPMTLEELPKSTSLLPLKKRKPMSETVQQLSTLPLKKFAKQNIFRDFVVENQVYESPGSKHCKNMYSKPHDTFLTENNFGVSNRNKINKNMLEENVSFISESEDHVELNSSGYMSKVSQDLTHDDDSNNSNEFLDPSKYSNLFFKDGKRINKNVLKRHSRVLGEAINIIKNSDSTLGLGLKRSKSVLDNYLDNPKSVLFLLESKCNKMKNLPSRKLKLQNEYPDTSISCELEEIEVTMTVQSEQQPKHFENKDKLSTPCTTNKDLIKIIKNKNVFSNARPVKNVKKNAISSKYEDVCHIYPKTPDNKIKSSADYDFSSESKKNNLGNNGDKIINAYQRNSDSSEEDAEFPQNSSKGKEAINSSSSGDSSENTSSDNYSSEDELVANKLLGEATRSITSNLSDRVTSNILDVDPKLSLESTMVNDISEKYSTLAKNVQSDLNLSSESSEEEECFNHSLNIKNSKENGHNELNYRDKSEKEYSTTNSVEVFENRKNRKIEAVDNTSDLRITIQGKYNDKKIKQNLIYNSAQILSMSSTNSECVDETKPTNYYENCDSVHQLPWTSTSFILNDDLALSENSSPPSSTQKHRILWNKGKEWDNEFIENEDEFDDGLNEGKKHEEKSENKFIEEKIDKEEKDYETELDYEVDEITEEEEEKKIKIHVAPSMLNLMKKNDLQKQDTHGIKMLLQGDETKEIENEASVNKKYFHSVVDKQEGPDDAGNIERGNASQDINAAVSERSNQDADVLSIYAESLFSQDEDIDGSGDVSINGGQATFTVKINKALHELEVNAELENVEVNKDTSVIQKEGCKPIWEGMMSPQAELAEFNLTAFPVSGNTSVFSENLSREIEVSGMAQPHMVHSYLTLRKSKSSKDIVIVKFEPIDGDDKQAYQDFVLYLLIHKQYAIIGNCPKRVKNFYVAPLLAQHPIPEVFLPFDGPGLAQCDYHLLIGIMILSKNFAQGKKGNKGKLTSKRMPIVIEDEQKTTQEEHFGIKNLKEDLPTKTRNLIKLQEDLKTANTVYQMPPMNFNPHDSVGQLEFISQLNKTKHDFYFNGACTPECNINHNMFPRETASLLSTLIQQALSENEEKRAWEIFDKYVANHPNIPYLGLEAMKPIARLILTSNVVLPAPAHIKHYLDGAKVVVLCELSKGDEAYILFRICHVDLPVTIKRTVTYSFIRFCGNHKVDDNESPWTKVQNWELENPSCILTTHQKGVKELLESSWLEFHMDSKNVEKVWSIFTSLCSEMHKYNSFFKKLTNMVIEFFYDIGQVKMAFCVLDEVRRLQANDVEIFIPLIPLLFEPNICINLSVELLFACEVIIELGVVLPEHDIEELIKFFASIDKIDVALKLALLSIKSSISVDITVLEVIVKHFDCMTHSLGKLYELLKLQNYANLRFLKPSLSKVLGPVGLSGSSLNFHQNKVIYNIEEYCRDHGIILLKGAEGQILPSKRGLNENETYSLPLQCPQDDAQILQKERKCYKSPIKGTCKQLTTTEDIKKKSEIKRKIISNQSIVSKSSSITSEEIEKQGDKSIIKVHDDELVISRDHNKVPDQMEKNGDSSTINSDMTYPILSKCSSRYDEAVIKLISKTNKGLEVSPQSSLKYIEKEKLLKERSINEHLNKDDLQGNNKLPWLLNNAQKLTGITKTNSNFGCDEKDSDNIKLDSQEIKYLLEQHASSPIKSKTMNDFSQRCGLEIFQSFPSKNCPVHTPPHTQEPPVQEQHSTKLGKCNLINYSKHCLEGATQINLHSNNIGMQTLQSERHNIQKQFSSPFGEHKVMKHFHSNSEGTRLQSFISDKNQLQGLSVTVNISHDDLVPSRKSVFYNNKDSQITDQQSTSNDKSISADKIAQRAFEILDKKRLLRNIQKHVPSSQIIKHSQDKTQDAICKAPDIVEEQIKDKAFDIASGTGSQVPKINLRDPRLYKKISFEEYKMENRIEFHSDINNKQHNQDENESNKAPSFKENCNTNIEDIKDLSTFTSVSSVGSTPPLEIDEEIESLTSENIHVNVDTNDNQGSRMENITLDSVIEKEACNFSFPQTCNAEQEDSLKLHLSQQISPHSTFMKAVEDDDIDTIAQHLNRLSKDQDEQNFCEEAKEVILALISKDALHKAANNFISICSKLKELNDLDEIPISLKVMEQIIGVLASSLLAESYIRNLMDQAAIIANFVIKRKIKFYLYMPVHMNSTINEQQLMMMAAESLCKVADYEMLSHIIKELDLSGGENDVKMRVSKLSNMLKELLNFCQLDQGKEEISVEGMRIIIMILNYLIRSYHHDCNVLGKEYNELIQLDNELLKAWQCMKACGPIWDGSVTEFVSMVHLALNSGVNLPLQMSNDPALKITIPQKLEVSPIRVDASSLLETTVMGPRAHGRGRYQHKRDETQPNMRSSNKYNHHNMKQSRSDNNFSLNRRGRGGKKRRSRKK